ncbi:carbohydrate porin [Gluconobacter morbifer]|uniref:Porin n=1 Tax=Gluconobacter morbifer G707 TaxID=1088869 RepID=G6XJQ9_9PROT|nr:carbohydrate porin [Gluconobacter morbifer]EHH67871.1 porin [Gluconobacter morbifer G707]
MSRVSFRVALCAAIFLPSGVVAQGTDLSTGTPQSGTVLQSAPSPQQVSTVQARGGAMPATPGTTWPDQNSVLPSERVNTPLNVVQFGQEWVPPLPQPEAILVNPFGWNSWLRDRGVAFTMDTTNEFSGAITKPTPGYGLKQGSSNAGQYSLENDIDWERLAGLRGFSTHMLVVGRYGIPASRMFGDNLNPSSEIYGAGGNVVVHLVYAYAEETIAKGRVDLAGGRIPFLNDFSSNPLYCTFQNNAFCGNPKASSDNIAHSSYPDANWAFRIRTRPTTSTYIQTGVYFVAAGLYGNVQYRTGFKFNGADITGESIPVEAGWEPVFGKDRLPGHYKLGYAIDNSPHADNYYDVNGNPYVLTGLGARTVHYSWSAWALADQMILRHHVRGNPDAGLVIIGGMYANSPRTQLRAQQYEVGLIDSGFWASRPLDTIGINFSYVRVSKWATATERLQAERGMSLMAGSLMPQTFGEVLEATYRIHVWRGITFAPDFQYYFRPGAQSGLRDAAMLGFKSHIQFF